MNYRNVDYTNPEELKKAFLRLACCSTSDSLGMGSELVGGDPNAVMFLDGSSLVDTSTNFTFDGVDSFSVGTNFKWRFSQLDSTPGYQALYVGSQTGGGWSFASNTTGGATYMQGGTVNQFWVGGAIKAKLTGTGLYVGNTDGTQLAKLHVIGDNISTVGALIDTPVGQTAKILDLQINGVSKTFVNNLGAIVTSASNNEIRSIRTNGGGFSLYQPVTVSGGNALLYSSAGTLGGTSGSGIAISYNFTVNSSVTAGYEGLRLGVVETAVGSGEKNLIHLLVGGVSKFKVDNTGLIITDSTTLMATSSALTDNSGAGAGTLANAPTAGDPTKWIQIDDNGTTRYIPTWT